MTRVRIRRPSPSTAIALLALFIALAGSAYAVQLINGKSIAKRTIPGNRLKRHAVGGTEVNAGSLGAILLRGRGHSYFGVADAPISPSASCGSTVARVRIVAVRGFGFADGYCSDYNFGTPICSFSFHNTTASTFSAVREQEVGGEGVGPYPPSLSYTKLTPHSALDEGTNAPVERVLWQIGLGGTSPRLLTVVVTQGHPNSSATACHFQADAIVQGA